MTKRGQPREVPPERKTMGYPCIFDLFSMLGCDCGRHASMVFPN